ncbi:MAG: thiosulfate oxidation carrier protein SoxY [Magnetococcales bacterium]|nr:thiosulfate oxidation carrier protein SoxY [Magnetococcales bacterium]
MHRTKSKQWSRRDFFLATGAVGLGAVAVAALPRMAEAADISAVIAEHVGPGTPAMEKVIVDVPEKAESGALVRLPIKVEHPMEPGNYVESITIFVEDNPKPLVGKFEFFPETGAADMEVRIKMAKASNVHVVAKTNSGKLFGVVKKIDVAEGGCAG